MWTIYFYFQYYFETPIVISLNDTEINGSNKKAIMFNILLPLNFYHNFGPPNFIVHIIGILVVVTAVCVSPCITLGFLPGNRRLHPQITRYPRTIFH